MEERGEGRSSARLTRKPLSDLTNTTLPPPHPRRNIPLKPRSAGIFPNTTNKPSDFNSGKKNQNPRITKNEEDKSHTSTGSNNSPVSNSVPSLPPTPRPLSAPVQSDKAHRAATKIQKLDKQTRKDKEKLVGSAPIIQVSAFLTSEGAKLSSSAISGSGGYDCSPAAVDNLKLDEQKRKDKGKMVVETPPIHISVPLTSHTLPASSSATSGNLYLPGPSTIHSQKLDAQASKDNWQMVQETPIIEQSDPRTPPSHIVSSSAASDDQGKHSLIVYKQRRGPQRKMHTDPSINLLLSCPPDKRMMKNRIEVTDGGAGGHSGSHTDPLPVRKKKRSRNKCGESMHAMSQDEVEKLKAYFADVDAFELPEEVASESELE